MGILLVVGLAGFTASLVDNSLGMGFGPTSATILLAAGLTPAAVSTTVNLAKVVIGVASGTAHWRFGNVDRRLVLRLAAPACLGVAAGVTALANIEGERIRPYLAALLLAVGLRMLLRWSRPRHRTDDVEVPPTNGVGRLARRRGVEAAAVAGGATTGLIGVWGPLVTPVLLHTRGIEPRVAIGSVSAAEPIVALAATASLFASLGGAGVDAGMLGAMLIGGVVAAPIAAWLTRRLPPHALGGAVAVLLLVTNTRELAGWAGLGMARWAVYAVVAALVLLALLRPRLAARRGRRAGSLPLTPSTSVTGRRHIIERDAEPHVMVE